MKPLPLWALCCLSSISTALAIDIDGHSAADNDRFADNSSFIGNSFDLSGVGRTTTGNSGKGGYWATMISKNVFLSANHYHPGTGDDLYFYSDNDPSTAAFLSSVGGGQRLGTSDLWIGYINSPTPGSITYFDWITDSHTPASYAASALALEDVYMVGITPSSTTYGTNRKTSMAMGTNIVDAFGDVTVDSTTAPALQTTRQQAADIGHTTHEAQLMDGDSGGPLFREVGGELQLIGINWAVGLVDIAPGPAQVVRESSYFSYIGNYSTEIKTYIDAHPVTAPEPSTGFALAMGLLILSARRDR